ncbi:Pimeloyl-ACP methyl ester carboxylesterase [Parapedobacter composti]|uniref:Pimeloyl-ACP methyl ester carboxylesterase n=1 Tax=Parapedobacter composti TaxID=623281 RepID=A0A1I1HBL3_9SPHI|nr:alpha/beta fold hydrolase [Parapedobacter composti]SFC21354.1 Pimeloyl-ACP methyl ester carboxylesterase [Parapedobacter composti]
MKYNKNLLKRKRIRIGDISISYLIHEGVSSSKTVVFIHGFPFNKNMWLPQLEALPADVTGIAVDVRGHGNSTAGHGFFSVDVFAKDLLVFLRKLEIHQSVLCGVSMGGYIALRTYQLQPEVFSALILSDTNSLADDNDAKIKRFDSIQSVLKHGKRAFSIGFVNNVFSQRSLTENTAAVDLIKSSIRRNTESSICATLLALASRTDTTESLKDITVPTLVIRGTEDRITTKEQADILVSNIPGATYVEIPECGHLPNLEAPDLFNNEMNALLAQI